MKKILLYGFLALLCSSCGRPFLKNITKQLPPLENDAEVMVYDMGDTVPEHAEILGGIIFLQKIDQENMLEIAKKEARAAGGNALEIQMHVYPNEEEINTHQISAFFLNINDSITPIPPTEFEKIDFHDYVVMLDGDTIPCFIADETDNSILFVYDFNRQGYKKTVSIPKSKLLSYHVEDPEALALAHYNRNKKLFTTQIAIDAGYTAGGTYAIATNVRFCRKNTVAIPSHAYSTIGFHYDHSPEPYNSHFIAGSIGFIGCSTNLKHNQLLDYYFDGTCNLPKLRMKGSIYSNLLLGYMHYIDHHDLNRDVVGIGFDQGFDFKINEHLGIGMLWYGYFGIPNYYGGAFCITAGLHYYL